MSVLVTGVAGFIGFHVALQLLDRGEAVIGVDSLNAYYDPALKQARLAQLLPHGRFSFHLADVADRPAMGEVARAHPDITAYVHLAAQAGVRYSLQEPHAYSHANVEGHLVLLEMARANEQCRHFVYASSSSVYGANTKLPFSVEDRVDHPVSLYAATKRAGELMSHCYSHLYRIPTTGLRFFTVYGPWGRPDMAPSLFAKAIAAGEPISVFNDGKMRRDFTFIDDIVTGVLRVLDRPPQGESLARLYNIGNSRSEALMDFIALLEQSLERKALCRFLPMQMGDVVETYADIEPLRQETGFEPTTPITVGIPKFIAWYRTYHGV